jgi:ABC-2 type transport system permease protein
MSGILTLALKDLRLLLRDRSSLFWVLVWPLANGLIFGSIMGGMGPKPRTGMPIAVVDQDSTAASRSFVERLEKSAALKVVRLPLTEARDQVRRGERAGYVRLKPGYAKTTGFGGGESNSAGLEIGMDPSRTAEKAYLQGLIMQASFQGMQDLFSRPDSMRRMVHGSIGSIDSAGDLPPAERRKVKRFLTSLDEYLGTVDTATYRRGGMGMGEPKVDVASVLREQTGPRSGFEISFPVAILWALIGCSAGFAQSMVHERTIGTFLRLRTTPLSRAAIVAGKGLACLLASLAVIATLLTLGAGVLGVRLTNPAGIAVAVACAALCFTGLMMFISSLGQTEQAVSGAGWAILLIMAMTGGGMIPLIAMPPWMLAVSHASPVKWGVLALEGAIWRGFSFAEMVGPCAILLGAGALAFALGVAMSRRKRI